MQPHLTRLPPEILNAIFGEFSVHCRDQSSDAYLSGDGQQSTEPSWYSLHRHALISLCLTSRHILPYAQSVLYHEFGPRYSDSWRTMCYTWPERLANFLRTISRRPGLASMVKKLHVDPKIMFFVDPEQALTAARVVAAHSEMDASEMEDDRDESQSWSRHAWHHINSESSRELVQMIFLQLPELEEISFKNCFLNSQSLFQRRPTHSIVPSHTIPPRPQIRRISVTNDRENSKHLNDFRTLATDVLEWIAPDHLQELHLHMFAASDNPRMPPQSLANLKTLRITSSRFDKVALSTILSSIRSLENFIYESAPPTSFSDYSSLEINDPFEPSDAVDCLQKHRASLARLHLQFTNYKWRNISVGHNLPEGCSTSLHDFKLKHLLVSANVIYDHLYATPEGTSLWGSLLPTSLESLVIKDSIFTLASERRIVAGLLGLAEAAAAKQYPCLRLLTCDDIDPIDAYHKHGIPSAFKAGGVDFKLSSWPLSEATSNGNGFWPGGGRPVLSAVELPPEDEDDDL